MARVVLSCRERWAGQTVPEPPDLAVCPRPLENLPVPVEVVRGLSVPTLERRKLLLPGRLSLGRGGIC